MIKQGTSEKLLKRLEDSQDPDLLTQIKNLVETTRGLAEKEVSFEEVAMVVGYAYHSANDATFKVLTDLIIKMTKK